MINKSHLNTSTPCQLENEAMAGVLLAYESKVWVSIFQCVLREDTVHVSYIHLIWLGVWWWRCKTSPGMISSNKEKYLLRAAQHFILSVSVYPPYQSSHCLSCPPLLPHCGRLRQLVHFVKASCSSLIMLTASYQIKAVTATVGRHWSEQCGFQWLNGSTTRGQFYPSLSYRHCLSCEGLVNSILGRFSCGLFRSRIYVTTDGVLHLC